MLKESSRTPGLRWQLPLAMLVTVLFSYYDRMNISFALPMIAEDYGWTVEEVGKYGGMLMSVFYIGYGLANMLLSPLGEKFGPKKSLCIVIVLFSIFAALQAPFGMILTGLVAVRFLLGLSEGIHFPMLNIMVKNWFPVHERSRANGIWICGLFLSMISAPFVVVPITERFGWQAMFIAVGLAGMVISLPLVVKFLYNRPQDHPRITEEEMRFITRGMEKDEVHDLSFRQGLGILAKKKAYWVAVLGGIANNMVSFGLLNWLPIYFTQGRGLAFSDLSYATSIPYAFSIFGILLWAYLGDKTNQRALLAGIGFFGAAAGAYFAATSPTLPMVVALFALTIFIQISFAANEFAIIQRIVPRDMIGTGAGFYNGFCMLVGGGLGPVIVGSIVSATGSYTMGLISLTGICAFGGIVMIILGRLIKY